MPNKTDGFSDLLKTWVDEHELGLRFTKALGYETDRGAVLVAAAFLDEQLRRLIAASFVAVKNVLHGYSVKNGMVVTRPLRRFQQGLIWRTHSVS